MISRLRRKATANHMTLPIRAVHGWGYMFAADIKLDLDERAQATMAPKNGDAIRPSRTRRHTEYNLEGKYAQTRDGSASGSDRQEAGEKRGAAPKVRRRAKTTREQEPSAGTDAFYLDHAIPTFVPHYSRSE